MAVLIPLLPGSPAEGDLDEGVVDHLVVEFDSYYGRRAVEFLRSARALISLPQLRSAVGVHHAAGDFTPAGACAAARESKRGLCAR